jgi:iron complex outermembrane receptor protein
MSVNSDLSESICASPCHSEPPQYLNNVIIALALGCLIYGPGALAQDDPRATDTNDKVIEEIVVTAQRREENVQDIPISIAAFTERELKELRIILARQIAQYTPNVNVQGGVITIRGIGMNASTANANASVGVYIDDVYLSSVTMMNFQVFDTERIEVLRGPQGTLYGRNTTGGAINYVSRKPTEEFDAFVRADAGNYETFNIEAALGGPLGDSTNGRVAFVSNQQSEGQYTNRLTGNDHGVIDSMAWRVLLDWQPSDNVGVLFNVHGAQNSSDVNLDEHFGILDPNTGGFCQAALEGRVDHQNCTDALGYSDPDGDPFTGDYSLEGKYNSDAFGAAITLKWVLPAFTFTSISGYEEISIDRSADADASPFNFFEVYATEYIDQFSQEFRLTSAPHDVFNWVAGFFYARAAVDEPELILQVDDLLGTHAWVSYEQETDATALFAHGGWQLNDRWRLVGGLRYTDEDRSYVGGSADLNPFGTSCFLDPIACNPGLTGPVFISTTDDVETDSDLSGEIGVNYTPADNRLIYAKISKGFKGGGWDGELTLDSFQLEPFKSETVLAYEIGFKSLLMDQSLQLNLAGFYYDYEDIQLNAFVGSAPIPSLTNASEADIFGFDAELRWNPNESLSLNFGLGYLSTENKDPRFAGLELTNSPKWNGNATARYAWHLSNGAEPFAMLNVSYTGSAYTIASNSPFYEAPAYTLVDGRLGLTGADRRWEAALWVQNLTDEIYFVGSFLDQGGFGNSGYRVYEMPRTYGVSFTWRWQ